MPPRGELERWTFLVPICCFAGHLPHSTSLLPAAPLWLSFSFKGFLGRLFEKSPIPDTSGRVLLKSLVLQGEDGGGEGV